MGKYCKNCRTFIGQYWFRNNYAIGDGSSEEFCSAVCRSSYAEFQRQERVRQAQERARAEEQRQAERKAETEAARLRAEEKSRQDAIEKELASKREHKNQQRYQLLLKEIWSLDEANRQGFHPADIWEVGCPQCGAVSANESLGSCISCNGNNLALGFQIDQFGMLDGFTFVHLASRCSDCANEVFWEMKCRSCGDPLPDSRVRVISGGGYDVVPILANISPWITGWRILECVTSSSWLGRRHGIHVLSELRRVYSIPQLYPIVGVASFATRLIVAGNFLFFRDWRGIQRSTSLQSLQHLSINRPRRGLFSTNFKFAVGSFKLRNREASAFMEFIDRLADRLP